jgi:hypothetical protein
VDLPARDGASRAEGAAAHSVARRADEADDSQNTLQELLPKLSAAEVTACTKALAEGTDPTAMKAACGEHGPAIVAAVFKVAEASAVAAVARETWRAEGDNSYWGLDIRGNWALLTGE